MWWYHVVFDGDGDVGRALRTEILEWLFIIP